MFNHANIINFSIVSKMPNLVQQLLEGNTLAALLLERPDLFENLAARLPHLLREFPNLDDEQIEAAYAADPARGKYTRWICRMLVNGVLRFPEDAEKVNQRLTQFKELSRKNDWEGEKDINKYKSYGDLARVVDANMGVETKGEVKRRRAVEGAELIWEEGEKQIYKVTTVEGGLALGWRNTEWCVKDLQYFDDYGPPFYCMLVSGKPSILAHVSSNGVQVMDEYDNPTDEWEDFAKAGAIDVYNNPAAAYCYAYDVLKGGRWRGGEKTLAEHPRWAYEYAHNIIKGRWPEAEPYIMKDLMWAGYYASGIIKGRWPEAEPYIMKSLGTICQYASDVIGGRWPEAEPIILKDPEWAYTYARDVIGGRWPEAEPIILKNNFALDYACNVIRGRWPELEANIIKEKNSKQAYSYAYDILDGERWPEGELVIMQDPECAYLYAHVIINDRWPEAEPYIMKDPRWAYNYAADVIRGRWPEAEPYIKKYPKWARQYAEYVIYGRWPEAEPTIMKDPECAYYYALDVIGGRWPEAEPYIEKDPVQSRQYQRFLSDLQEDA